MLSTKLSLHLLQHQMGIDGGKTDNLIRYRYKLAEVGCRSRFTVIEPPTSRVSYIQGFQRGGLWIGSVLLDSGETYPYCSFRSFPIARLDNDRIA